MIVLIISLLIYGSPIIILGILAGHPVIGILLALFVVLSLYATSIYSQLVGAENALRNPPNPGATHVSLTAFDKVIWQSQSFNFVQLTSSPSDEDIIKTEHTPAPKAEGDSNPYTIELFEHDIELPKTRVTWERWKRIYLAYKGIKAQDRTLSEKEIHARIEAEERERHETISNRLLLTIRTAGDNGYLTTWEEFCKRTGRALD